MKEGDVILTPVPQANGIIKNRPAIILREMPPFNNGTRDKSFDPTAQLRAFHQSSFDEIGCYSFATAEVRR